MGTIYISTTNRSAASLGILAEGSNAATAIRNVARQLIESGRCDALPVIVTDTAGFTLARIPSLAIATLPEAFTRDVTAHLPRQRAATTSIVHGDLRAA